MKKKIKEKREYDIYRCNEKDTFRYLMGNYGENILLCIGINPSTANKEEADATITRLDRYCEDKYSWVMYNVYPERATKPNELAEIRNEDYHNKNIQELKDFLADIPKEKLTILAAWGAPIEKRKYLKECLKDIYAITKDYKWTCIRTTKKGHPKHWIGANYPDELKEFDLESYLR